MKVLGAVVSVLGVLTVVSAFTTNHNLLKRSQSAADEAAVAVLEGMRLYGPRLDQLIPSVKRSVDVIRVEGELQQQLTHILHEHLQTYLDTAQHLAHLAEQMYNQLMHTLHQEMLHLLADGSNIHQLAEDFIAALQDNYQHLLQEILPGLNKDGEVMFDSVLSLASTLLSHLIGELDFSSILSSIGNSVLELLGGAGASAVGGAPRILSSIWNIITDTIGSILFSLGEQYDAFKDWIQLTLQAGLDFAQPHIDNIKELAQLVIDNITSMPQQVIIQALAFFRPWQDTLGPLWDKLLELGSNLLP